MSFRLQRTDCNQPVLEGSTETVLYQSEEEINMEESVRRNTSERQISEIVKAAPLRTLRRAGFDLGRPHPGSTPSDQTTGA